MSSPSVAMRRCEETAPAGTKITTHVCDVSDEKQVLAFRDAVRKEHGDHVDLLFNNAGIGGGDSFVAGDRAEWERTFAVCWWASGVSQPGRVRHGRAGCDRGGAVLVGALPVSFTAIAATEWLLGLRRTIPAADLRTGPGDVLIRCAQAASLLYGALTLLFWRERAEWVSLGAARSCSTAERASSPETIAD